MVIIELYAKCRVRQGLCHTAYYDYCIWVVFHQVAKMVSGITMVVKFDHRFPVYL